MAVCVNKRVRCSKMYFKIRNKIGKISEKLGKIKESVSEGGALLKGKKGKAKLIEIYKEH